MDSVIPFRENILKINHYSYNDKTTLDIANSISVSVFERARVYLIKGCSRPPLITLALHTNGKRREQNRINSAALVLSFCVHLNIACPSNYSPHIFSAAPVVK